MADTKTKINTKQLAAKLKELQNEFSKNNNDLMAYLRAKPLNVDFEVNKDDIVFSFDLDRDNGITVVVKTDYDYGKLVSAEIEYIEVDNIEDTYELESDDDSALLLECKRIIHDAVHYKLLDGDDEIETNFYGEVYA